MTQQIGALQDHYLSRRRPLGEARVLWEIGEGGCDVRVLRARLDLDSGYLSRLLRSLEADGLVTVGGSLADQRVRTARLTPKGRKERAELDRRSDDLARSVLEPLTDRQQLRMVDAMAEVERLLTAALVDIDVVDPSHRHAHHCLQQYYAELDQRFDAGYDPERSIPALAHEMRPPDGGFLVATLRSEPVACGGIKLHGRKPAELKRMWVAPGTPRARRGPADAQLARGVGGGARGHRSAARDEPRAHRGDRAVPLVRLSRGRGVQRRAVRRPLVREAAAPREESIMSGPVTTRDAPVEGEEPEAGSPELEVTESREAQVGAFRVRRALPHRPRRTVGAWCFVDHMGPAQVSEEHGIDIGPHPHIGLQTVTWLLDGEVLHRDSLGSEQVIRPGQLNLMTAGNGVSHAEEATGRYRGPLHGVQLWVAQPSSTRAGDPAFEHHAELPSVELGPTTATVLVGDFGDTSSPARRDSRHVGVDLSIRAGTTEIPLDAAFEHALVVFDGEVSIEGRAIPPGRLAYLGSGRDQCALTVAGPSRALLIGGEPFDERVLMWWNFVARTREEISEARDDWMAGHERFGEVASPLARIDVGEPPWRS